jgi:hypothetical protein
MGTALLEGTQGNEFNCHHLGDSMNKRILELAEQATSYRPGRPPYDGLTFDMFDREKFAELIVQECKENFAKVWYEQGMDIRGADLDKFLTRLEEHFGVES